jgi:hypothetical protein
VWPWQVTELLPTEQVVPRYNSASGRARLPRAEAWQISAVGRNDYMTPEGIRIAPALALLSRLI